MGKNITQVKKKGRQARYQKRLKARRAEARAAGQKKR